MEFLEDKRHEMIRIAKTHGASELRVFGSVARGEMKPDSDIDVIVTLDHGRTLLDLVAIKQDLEDLLGRKVHVVTEASISPYIRDKILKEAVNL